MVMPRGLLAAVVACAASGLKTYNATQPWDATFSIDLGKAAGQPQEATLVVRVHPEWAPEGAKRFQEIVQNGILSDARFFRVVPNFMAQFGIPADPKVAGEWREKTIADDPVKRSNTRGMVTFATSGPNSRTTQMFINFKDNSMLDEQGFAPFAEIVGNGMAVVDRIQKKYGETPDQDEIQNEGNAYLEAQFPDLSFVRSLTAGDPQPASTQEKAAAPLLVSKAPASTPALRSGAKAA